MTTNGPNFFAQFNSFAQPNHDFYMGPSNPQTGTSYTVDAADLGALTTFSNASPVAVTLPVSTNAVPLTSYASHHQFAKGWFAFYLNKGAGDVTFTPTTSTINGAATLVLHINDSMILMADGANYSAIVIRASGASGVTTLNGLSGTLAISAGAGIAVTTSGSNVQVAATGSGGSFSPDTTAFTTSTPTPTAGSGTFTSASCTLHYKLLSAATKICFISVNVNITTNGTAATRIHVPLPYTPLASGLYFLNGMECNSTGNKLSGYIKASPDECQITDYANNYPGGTGRNCVVSGFYEVA